MARRGSIQRHVAFAFGAIGDIARTATLRQTRPVLSDYDFNTSNIAGTVEAAPVPVEMPRDEIIPLGGDLGAGTSSGAPAPGAVAPGTVRADIETAEPALPLEFNEREVRIIIENIRRGEVITDQNVVIENNQGITMQALIDAQDIEDPSVYDQLIVDGQAWNIFAHENFLEFIIRLRLSREV